MLSTSRLKEILTGLGGAPSYHANAIDTLRAIVTAEGGSWHYHDNGAALLKKWLDAAGGTSLYSDSIEQTLDKIAAAYGGGSTYQLNRSGKLAAILVAVGPCVIPELVSATIVGNDLTLTFSRAVTGTEGFTVEINGGSANLTYASGVGGSTLNYTTDPPGAAEGEEVLLDYNPGNVQSGAECPLAPIDDFAVTNNSGVNPSVLAGSESINAGSETVNAGAT